MMNRLFEPVRGTNRRGSNITEHEDSFEWSVDMPGVDRENIDVTVNDRQGTIEVSTTFEESDDDIKRHRDYFYSVRFGDTIDTEDISAEYDSGVLTVTLPKTEREENTRKIEVT